MRAHASSDVRILALALGALLLSASELRADVGGGRPSTPYHLQPTEEDVRDAKTRAAQRQCVCFSPPVGPLQTLRTVRIVGLTSGQIAQVKAHRFDDGLLERAVFELKGTDAAGAPTAVSLSEMESFSVVKATAERLWLDIVKWPDISAARLLKEKPDYTALLAGYRTKLTLIFDLAWPEATRPVLLEVLGLNGVVFSELQPGTQVQFYCGDPKNVDPGRFWWAIPSVVRDPAYPYRTVWAE